MLESPFIVTDPRLAEAIRRRDAAVREAREWDDFITKYKMLEQVPVSSQPRQATGRTTAAARPAFGGYKTPKTKEVLRTLEIARTILEERGRPVGTADLYSQVTARGIKIGGRKPKVAFDGRLRYASAFVNIKGQGWWLADLPVPKPNGLAADIHETPAAQEDQVSSP